jgi:hypothetical protein
MVDDISKLYAKILEEQNEKDSKTPIVENHLIEENESQISYSFPKEEPFDNFLLKLGEKLAEHLDISEDVEDDQNEEVDDSENNYAGIPLEKQTTKSSYIEELQKMDKGDKSKLISKNDNISATISEQVKEEIGKVKTQISRMAIEGGGGSVAVQYAKGGVMNGDLNVTGKYLSGGIDLSTIIGSGGSSGGGGLSGTTDRLVSGTEVFKLNTDGTFNFPNNIITPQDEIILTLEATKVLDGYYNRLALSPHGFFASDHNGNSITIDSTDNEILIDSNNTYYWKFNNQGALEGPFGTLSVSGNLSATGRVYQNGNDLQSEIESISAISISTTTTVQSNSASWNYQGSDIKALTGGWVGGNAAYTTVQANSASWAIDSTTDTGVRALTAGWIGGNAAYTNLVYNSAAYLSGYDLSFLSVSGNWNSAYTTVNTNSASWAIDSTTDTGVRALTSNWQNTFTTVQDNSANWNYQGSDIKALTGEWVGGNAAYTNLVANSAAYLSGVAIDLSFLSVSGNWNSVYSTVNSNSASWDYQGSDIKALTGNWQEAYTNLVSNSAAYLSSVDLSFLSVSTNWDSVYTTVLNESASWIGGGGSISGDYLPLSGGTMTGAISFGSLYGSKIDQGVYDSSRSGLSGISLVCSVNYDFNWQAGWITSLQQDRLTPMPLYIDSGAGTSLRVWNGNYIGDGTGTEITHTGITFADNTNQTTAFTGNTLSFDETTKDLSISNGNTVSLSALVDSTTDTGVRLLTSNWESTFTTVLGNSADWEGAYTTLQANSGTWGLSTTSEVLIAEVKNAEAIQLVRGDVVYAFGATGGTMSVKLASAATEAGSSKTIGIVNGTISAGGTGYITCVGRMENLNLGAFSEGDGLWLSTTPGDFTNVRPTQPNHGVYIGVVERANNGNGILYVRIQNGYELNEIHDVLINGVKAGDSLQRNNTNTLWINVPLSANTTYTTVNSNSAAWSAVTSYSSLIGNNLTNPLTATHNLNTKDIIFSVREVTTNKIIQAAGRTVDDNNLELTFNSIPTVNQYDLTVLCNGGIAGTSNGTTNVFALTTLSSTTNIQSVAYTHYLYNDSITSGQMTVYLLPPSNHIGVTQHKKIGSTANVVLSAPNGATIDGQPTYTLMNQYEAIGLYTDGTNYFIQ